MLGIHILIDILEAPNNIVFEPTYANRNQSTPHNDNVEKKPQSKLYFCYG